MIYSPEINKICAVCQKAQKFSDDEMYCSVRNEAVALNTEACESFCYDILKRPVRRMRRLKTNYKKEDFTL